MTTDPAVTAAAEALTHYALPAYIAEVAVAAARPVIEAEVRRRHPMSTCRYAIPPHLDCPHGAACDYEEGAYAARKEEYRREEEARARAGLAPSGPMNRADRRRYERALRSTR